MSDRIVTEVFNSMLMNIESLKNGERPTDSIGAALFDTFNQGIDHALIVARSYREVIHGIDDTLDIACQGSPAPQATED
jgi:hypothetical protein